MSDDVIRKGDLVMIVAPASCCGDSSDLGKVFIVRWIGDVFESCAECGDYGDCLGADDEDDSYGAYPLKRLKKINPPPVEESITRRECEPA